MEVSTEKSKILMNSTTNTSAFTMNAEKQEIVTSFKNVDETLSKYGTSIAEVRKRVAMATAAMVIFSRYRTSCPFVVRLG
ncbi:hypothetical protein DPMN_110975 [Dreissena polymorpha]|uniref:Uncharacterized protein n=1 Tax=Dreissena polymorpha TaxID=45954 RepID=A0A9D4KDL3_DREPO|nr:hypothetical protein DPMN_110975 [Dreissena polymorpha]